MSSETKIIKPVLAFIPKDNYNSLSDKDRFLDFLELRLGNEYFKLKREYTFNDVIKILNKYKFEQVVAFNLDLDISPTFMQKKKLIRISIIKRINVYEMNSGLSTLNEDGTPDFNSISYFILRGNYHKRYAQKFFRGLFKINSMRA